MSSNHYLFQIKNLVFNTEYHLIIIIAILVATTTIIAAILYPRKSKSFHNIPLYLPEPTDKGNYKQRWVLDNANLLQEGYEKFQDRPFGVWTTEGIQICIHPKYAEEVKMLPSAALPSALRSFFLGNYLWPIKQWKLDYPHQVLKNDLAKNLPKLFPGIRDVIALNFPHDFPECPDWKPVLVHPSILKLVCRVSTKTFVGNGFEQDEEWLDISTNYIKYVFIGSAKLRWFNPIFRPIAQYFLSELRLVWRCNRRVKKLLAPIISQRLALEQNKDYIKPNDSIEWMRSLVPEPDRSDPFVHGISQLLIASVSVGSTSHLLTNVIHNLATWPEYIPILRQEIEDVLSEAGGEWTTDSMGQLKKLDSFIKETLRLYGHATITFQRLCVQPLTLSDGTHIPADTMIFTPTYSIANDPNIYTDPKTFDGLRFYKLRQTSPENERKYQFTTSTTEQMQLGMGRHACSGRYMASYQMKLVLASIICKYDIKLKDGEGRPKNVWFMAHMNPDVKAEILLKNRK